MREFYLFISSGVIYSTGIRPDYATVKSFLYTYQNYIHIYYERKFFTSNKKNLLAVMTFLNKYFVKFAILSYLYLNANIMKVILFHKMK